MTAKRTPAADNTTAARQALEAAVLEHASRTEAAAAAVAALASCDPDAAADWEAADRTARRTAAAAARALEDVERRRQELVAAERKSRVTALGQAVEASSRPQLFTRLEEPIGALAQADAALAVDHYSDSTDPAELGVAYARRVGALRLIRAAVEAQHQAVARALELAGELGETVRVAVVPEDHILSAAYVERLALAGDALDLPSLLAVSFTGEASRPTQSDLHGGKLPFAASAYAAIGRRACQLGSWRDACLEAHPREVRPVAPTACDSIFTAPLMRRSAGAAS